MVNKQGLNVDDCPLSLFSNIADFVFHFCSWQRRVCVGVCVAIESGFKVRVSSDLFMYVSSTA